MAHLQTRLRTRQEKIPIPNPRPLPKKILLQLRRLGQNYKDNPTRAPIPQTQRPFEVRNILDFLRGLRWSRNLSPRHRPQIPRADHQRAKVLAGAKWLENPASSKVKNAKILAKGPGFDQSIAILLQTLADLEVFLQTAHKIVKFRPSGASCLKFH